MAKVYLELPAGGGEWVTYELSNIANELMPSSIHSGVSWDKVKRRWTARFYNPATKKQKNLGYFDDPDVAARAWDAAAREHYGWDPDSKLYNFPADPEAGTKAHWS
jgi:hypothetical protein